MEEAFSGGLEQTRRQIKTRLRTRFLVLADGHFGFPPSAPRLSAPSLFFQLRLVGSNTATASPGTRLW